METHQILKFRMRDSWGNCQGHVFTFFFRLKCVAWEIQSKTDASADRSAQFIVPTLRFLCKEASYLYQFSRSTTRDYSLLSHSQFFAD